MTIDKKRTVIVTGGAGFLGKAVVAKLKEQGFTDIFVPRSSDYNLIEQAEVRKLYKDHPCDLVIHLAAVVGGIGANQQNPGKFFYENLMMGVMLMEEARQAGIKKFVAIGTICCYPKFTPVPFKEDDLWIGYPEETNAPYGLAKKMLLVQSQSYRQQYDFNSIYLMPVNLYGPADNFDDNSSHVIPALIKKCVEAKEKKAPFIELWGDGTPTREFLYVTDAADGIVNGALNYESSEPLNLGSGEEISIKDLAELIAEQVGFKGEVRWDVNKPNGQPRRRLDVSRAKDNLGWNAQVSLKQGIRETIDWYVSHTAGDAKQPVAAN
ncbi:MAG: GDP-L-fucose synthase [Candidatus Obscuribacterales bacterium]